MQTRPSRIEIADRLIEEYARDHRVDDEVQFLRALSRYFHVDFTGALEILNELEASETNLPDVYVWLSYLKSAWGFDFSGALSTASRGAKRFNRSASLLNSVAYHNILVGNLEGAQAIMSRKTWPGSLQEAIATQGLWFLRSGDFHRGVTYYNNANNLAQHDLQLVIEQKKRLEMGLFYLRSGRFLQASRELKRAMETDSVEKLDKLQAEGLLNELTERGQI